MILLSYIGVILLFIFKKRSHPIIFPKYLLFYLLFVIFIFYSTFIRLDRTFEIKYLFSNAKIGCINLMFIIENIPIPKKYFQNLLKISKIILIVAFVVIIIQQAYDPTFFVYPEYAKMSEVVGQGVNQNRLFSIYSWIGGLTTVGFGFVPIYILIVEEKEKDNKDILIWILLGLTFALLSKARWIMINTLLVFIIMLIHNRDKFKIFFKYLIILPIVFFIAFNALKAIGIDAQGIVMSRVLESDSKNLSQKSAGTRLLAYEALNRFYWDNPFFGKGDVKYGMGGAGKPDYQLERFLGGRSSQIHSGYASLLYRYGLVGGVLFLGFLILFFIRIYRSAQTTKRWAPFLGFLGFAIANLTLVNFDIFHMGFILALVAVKYYDQKKIYTINVKST